MTTKWLVNGHLEDPLIYPYEGRSKLSPEEITQITWMREIDGMTYEEISLKLNFSKAQISMADLKVRNYRRKTDYKIPDSVIWRLAKMIREKQATGYQKSALGFWL